VASSVPKASGRLSRGHPRSGRKRFLVATQLGQDAAAGVERVSRSRRDADSLVDERERLLAFPLRESQLGEEIQRTGRIVDTRENSAWDSEALSAARPPFTAPLRAAPRPPSCGYRRARTAW
jgi:hypothetical protein